MFRLAAKVNLLLLALPLLLAWWWRFLSRRSQRHVWFPAQALLPAQAPGLKPALIRLLGPLKMAALILFILALARPQRLHTYHVDEQKGMDILLTLDISGSMAAVDFKPKNRLEVAKEVIASFIEKRSSDRLGLVIFAATSYTKCPLTVDYDILKFYLQETELGELEDGTAIGMALAASVNRIRHAASKTKLIILLTDGVNNRGEIDPITAAQIAQSYGIRIYTVGVGTIGEAPYPRQTPFGVRYQMVPVEIDERVLRQVAAMTEGKYFRATDNRKLRAIYQEIDTMEKTRIEVRSYRRYAELFYPFVLIAVVLLIADIGLSTTWLRKIP